MALPTAKQYFEQAFDDNNIAYQTPILSQEQHHCLNRLVGAAAFDDTLRHRLICLRDETLCQTYNLSTITWGYLKRIEADTLEDFCVQVLKLQNKVLSY